jgi:hypothetical protein
MMGSHCHAGLVFPPSWLLHESVVSSTVADQLLILLLAWEAGPSPIPPPPWVDPISLRAHAFSRSLVSYTRSRSWSSVPDSGLFAAEPGYLFLQLFSAETVFLLLSVQCLQQLLDGVIFNNFLLLELLSFSVHQLVGEGGSVRC